MIDRALLRAWDLWLVALLPELVSFPSVTSVRRNFIETISLGPIVGTHGIGFTKSVLSISVILNSCFVDSLEVGHIKLFLQLVRFSFCLEVRQRGGNHKSIANLSAIPPPNSSIASMFPEVRSRKLEYLLLINEETFILGRRALLLLLLFETLNVDLEDFNCLFLVEVVIIQRQMYS